MSVIGIAKNYCTLHCTHTAAPHDFFKNNTVICEVVGPQKVMRAVS